MDQILKRKRIWVAALLNPQKLVTTGEAILVVSYYYANAWLSKTLEVFNQTAETFILEKHVFKHRQEPSIFLEQII